MFSVNHFPIGGGFLTPPPMRTTFNQNLKSNWTQADDVISARMKLFKENYFLWGYSSSLCVLYQHWVTRFTALSWHFHWPWDHLWDRALAPMRVNRFTSGQAPSKRWCIHMASRGTYMRLYSKHKTILSVSISITDKTKCTAFIQMCVPTTFIYSVQTAGHVECLVRWHDNE